MNDEDREYGEYPSEILGIISQRIPKEFFNVFTHIWNNKDEGISWKELVEAIGDRITVDKAVLFYEISGFVNCKSSSMDRRKKIYKADLIRGLQLAELIRDSKIRR
ncbi:hypothetical protein [Paenibacillus sp. MMO-177]|uniref:hypothetical protein n=1 Tax=Paenibacillus sp. MMO-177 TaxID=3081289 RepID=UPI003018F0E2